MQCVRRFGSAILFALLALLPVARSQPKILSCIAGVYKCIGVKDAVEAARFGCFVENITDCSGKTAFKPCGPCVDEQKLEFACLGQNLKNASSQDGTPVTFNYPVDMSSLKPDHFVWHFPDGSSHAVECAIPGGGPANEDNELQTIALVGNAGGWTTPATSIEVVGDLMLVAPNGSKVSAKGLHYDGPAMNYANGPILLTVDYELFSTKGETTKNRLLGNVYPNHCQALFPDTTHRLRLLFDGGVSLDSVKAITPDRTDLVQVLDAQGTALPEGVVLGLADLGGTIPKSQCEKDTYKDDGDNYLDVCLKMAADTPLPSKLHLPCTAGTQISNPKGPRYPCAPQTVDIAADGGAILAAVPVEPPGLN